MSLRVLMISHTCQSRHEGQPKCAWLARLPGIDLRVLVPDRWRNYGKWRPAEKPLESNYSYQVGQVLWPWAGPAQWYLHWYPHLAQVLREFQPDIIDIWEEPWGLVSAHTAWLRGRILPHARIISETEQNLSKTLPPPFEAFRSYTLRHADFLVGRSIEAIENTRAKGYSGPAAVVPNAVDSQLFRPLDRIKCREALGVSGFVVGYIGRIVEEKGLADLVDALARCPDEVNLLLVGSGSYQADMEHAARKMGIASRLRFMPARSLEELPQVMNALDVMVLPSRTTARWKEQFGRVIIEAHACGTPVIGSSSGAIPDVVGRGGMVFVERDPVALAAAIHELWANPSKGRELGEIGRRQVERCYTWQHVAEGMRDIYQSLMPSQKMTV